MGHYPMMAPLASARSRSEIEGIIATLDLARYEAHLQEYDGYSEDDARRCGELFKKFCVVAALNPGTYVWDHRETDTFIHAGMLYSPDWGVLCEKVFGGPLGHRPTLPGDVLPEVQATTIERTRALWREIFPNEDFDAVGTVLH